MRVALTGGSALLEERLRALGIRVLRVPVIRIAPPRDPLALKRAVREPFDLAVLASRNAERAFLKAGGKGARVGPGSSASLVRILRRRKLRGRIVLLPRSQVSPEALPRALRRMGALVRCVTSYRTLPVRLSRRSLSALAGADAVTFASASAASSLAASFRREGFSVRGIRAVSIGPETSRALRREGFRVAAGARPSSQAGLVRAVRKALKGTAS